MNLAETRQRVSVVLLCGICAFAVCREFGILADLAPAAGAAILIWIAIEWRDMALIARLTLSIALVLTAVFASRSSIPPDIMSRAIGRSAFFIFFLVSMDVLRTAALSSRMVLDAGRVLVNQPPGRRYVMITLGGHLFSMLLNLGAISLLGSMNRRSITKASRGTNATIREIQLRRMTLALVRGFTAFTMWAPTAVTVLIVLSALPDLNWYRFAPMGAFVVSLYLFFGWFLDRISYPKVTRPANAEPVGEVLMALSPMALLTVSIIAAAIAFSNLSGIRLIAALLTCVPIFGVAWIAFQYSRAGWRRALSLCARRVRRQILPELPTLRSEIAILAAAGFLAAILPYQINTDALGRFIADLGLTEGWLLVLLLWTVALAAPVGLNPIVSVSVSIEIIAQLSGFDFNPYMLAFAGTMAWGLASGSSPLGATIRVTGRSISRPPYEVGLVWNRTFSFCILVFASIILLILN